MDLSRAGTAGGWWAQRRCRRHTLCAPGSSAGEEPPQPETVIREQCKAARMSCHPARCPLSLLWEFQEQGGEGPENLLTNNPAQHTVFPVPLLPQLCGVIDGL